jgi:hypothetical protein
VDENKLEAIDRVRSDLDTRRAALLKNLSGDPEAKEHLDKLVATIDATVKDLDKKATGHRSLQTSLAGFNAEYERLNSYVHAKSAKLDAVDVLTGQFEAGDKNGKQVPQIQAIKSCIQQVQALVREASEVEEPKVEACLKVTLSDVKYKFWPEILCDEKLRFYQENVDELASRFTQLNEHGLAKVNELQTVSDYSLKYAQLKTSFEVYLTKVEAEVLSFEPIGIHLNVVNGQVDTLHKLIGEYESKSACLSELGVFTGTYVSLLGRLAGQRQQEKVTATGSGSLMSKLYKQMTVSNAAANSRSSSCDNLSSSFENTSTSRASSASSVSSSVTTGGGFESEVGQEMARLGQAYEWVGERLEERKRELAVAGESVRAYLEEVAAAEGVVEAGERAVREVFGVERLDEGRIRVRASGEEVERVKKRSGEVKERIGKETHAALETLKGKRLLVFFGWVWPCDTGIELNSCL